VFATILLPSAESSPTRGADYSEPLGLDKVTRALNLPASSWVGQMMWSLWKHSAEIVKNILQDRSNRSEIVRRTDFSRTSLVPPSCLKVANQIRKNTKRYEVGVIQWATEEN